MDALSEVFAAVRLSGGVFLDAEFTAPWCVVSQVGPEDFSAQGGTPAHLIAYHYIVAGRGIVRDIEGNSYQVGPGDVVYGPPGMRGAHEWEVPEMLQLLTIKATNAPERAIQFNIDRATMESRAELGYLVERGAADMKESFY